MMLRASSDANEVTLDLDAIVDGGAAGIVGRLSVMASAAEGIAGVSISDGASTGASPTSWLNSASRSAESFSRTRRNRSV